MNDDDDDLEILERPASIATVAGRLPGSNARSAAETAIGCEQWASLQSDASTGDHANEIPEQRSSFL
jgi:hypothetical protein